MHRPTLARTLALVAASMVAPNRLPPASRAPLMIADDARRSGHSGSPGTRSKRKAKQFARVAGRRMRRGR